MSISKRLELMLSQAGDLRILKQCDSQTCQGQNRLYNRIGKTQDRVFWAYSCERCNDYLYLPVPQKDRLRDKVVRLIT